MNNTNQMKYAIIKNKTVQKIITNNDDNYFMLFMNHVANMNENIKILELTEQCIKNDNSLGESQYLISDPGSHTIKLIAKNKIENKGFFYNTSDFIINIIDFWELYPFAITDSMINDSMINSVVNDTTINNKIDGMVDNSTINDKIDGMVDNSTINDKIDDVVDESMINDKID